MGIYWVCQSWWPLVNENFQEWNTEPSIQNSVKSRDYILDTGGKIE